MRTHKEIFIANTLRAKGVKKNTINFYIELLQHFEISDPLSSTSKKLALAFGCSTRTVQRYVKELSEQYNYIHVRPIWNNDNPDKPYKEYNIYTKTIHTDELLKKAIGFSKQGKSVYFHPEVSS